MFFKIVKMCVVFLSFFIEEMFVESVRSRGGVKMLRLGLILGGLLLGIVKEEYGRGLF